MKVTFLTHSAFLLEWGSFYTLFDCCFTEPYASELPRLDEKKPLLVFSSHRHADHFDPKIFDLMKQYPLTRFFLSRDVNLSDKRRAVLGITDALMERITLLRPDSAVSTEVNGTEITVRTVKSTDIGVAFLLHAEGRLVYHAGDLNRWHWTDEGEDYCAKMAESYTRAVEKLAAYAAEEKPSPVLDAAMIPFDTRLLDGYSLGALELLASLPAKHVFPMHMWSHFEFIDRFRAEHPELADSVANITANYQTFEVE